VAASNAAALARLCLAPLAESAALPHGSGESVSAITRFLTTILDRKLRSLDFLNSTL
jgi:hypothetical protein